MPPRPTRPEKDCARCPKQQAAAKAKKQPLGEAAKSVSESQGEYLWNHVLFGTNTCCQMIRGYAEAEMPGDPRKGIKDLIQSLTGTLALLESRHKSKGK